MTKILSLILSYLFIISSSYAMMTYEEMEEKPPSKEYNFLILKNTSNLHSDETKTKIQQYYYDKEGCVVLLNPNEESSTLLSSLYSPQSMLLKFFRNEKEMPWVLSTYSKQYNKFMEFPHTVGFKDFDFFFMRNREPSTQYQHPLPLIGFYVHKDTFDNSVENFLKTPYFNKRLSFGDQHQIKGKILTYQQSQEIEPLLIKVTKEPIRGLWRE